MNPMEKVKGDCSSGGSFFSLAKSHESKESVAAQIKTYFLNCLVEYKKRYGSLPVKIVGYRDGVNDGDVRKIFKF
jgi:hypothetical protein